MVLVLVGASDVVRSTECVYFFRVPNDSFCVPRSPFPGTTFCFTSFLYLNADILAFNLASISTTLNIAGTEKLYYFETINNLIIKNAFQGKNEF